MPSAWTRSSQLGSSVQVGESWVEAGTWAADRHGKLGTFVNSLGLGNALTGTGIRLGGGLRTKDWDFALETLALRDTQGQSYLTVYRGHALHKSQTGWTAGLEQEPLVWGYGLNGGYLLGEAARPFPRFRLESPMKAISLWGIPLGTWGFQTFVGRLEKDRVLSESIQDPSFRKPLLAYDPSAPLFNGYRFQATFSDVMEFYLNYTNLWSGTRNGKGMTDGYNLGEYFTAMFGLKDQLAEGGVNFSDPSRPDPSYKNHARSASNLDVGARIRFRFLEGPTRAHAVYAYISRGSKNTWWPLGVFVHKPLYYLGKDLEKDGRNLLTGRVGFFWNEKERMSVPNLVAPNDTAGMLFEWSQFRLGLEYSDITNAVVTGIKPFVTGEYSAGFYTYGDPLGNALGGESQTFTLRMDVDPTPRLSTSTWLHVGHRPFRDDLGAWMIDHPGATPAKNRFLGLQQTLRWNLNAATSARFGVSWQRQTSVDYEAGRVGNAFRWFIDVGYRWTSGHPRAPIPNSNQGSVEAFP